MARRRLPASSRPAARLPGRGPGPRRGWAIAACALVLALGIGLFASPPAAGQEEAVSARVRWAPGLERLGQRAGRSLPAIRGDVARRLGWLYDGPPVDVAIVADHDAMCAEARARVPRWAVGVAVSSRALIVIRADLLSAGFGGSLAQVLRHEWVHLAWGHRAGPRRRHLPLWAEEGLAEEIGGGISVDAGAALDLAVAFDRLLDFDDLARRFPDDPRAADLAYKQSRSWVQFLVSRVGWPVLRGILEDVASPPTAPRWDAAGATPFASALQQRTGRSLGDWHLDWRVALEEDATPWLVHVLLRDFQGLLLACLGVVAIGASVVLLRRRRRSIEALPDLPLPRA